MSFMLNLLPELYQCNNGGFLPMALRHSMEALYSEQPAPPGSFPSGEWSYLHLTSARWLLDGLAQLLQCAWLQATSPHRGSLIWDNQEPNWWLKCIQSCPKSLISMLNPHSCPLPTVPPTGSVPDLTAQRKGLPGPGQSHAAASAHISWGWKNCSHGSCCSQ